MQAPIFEVSNPPIAACFGYLARVWVVAGAEQCFGLLPVNAYLSLMFSGLFWNSHHISLLSFPIRFSFHPLLFNSSLANECKRNIYSSLRCLGLGTCHLALVLGSSLWLSLFLPSLETPVEPSIYNI